MKELKYLGEEVKRLYKEDEERSYAPLNENMELKYKTGYSYEHNHEEIHKLHAEELRIKSALAKYNSVTVIDEINMTIAEALVKMAQLKEEIKVLSPLADKSEIFKLQNYRYDEETYKIVYNQGKVIEDLRQLQRQLSKIQMAVDRINLTALVEY